MHSSGAFLSLLRPLPSQSIARGCVQPLHKSQPSSLFRSQIQRSFFRAYSAGPSKDEAFNRIYYVLANFHKIDEATAKKINLKSHLIHDLGLDSLDTVEVTLAVEEEFDIEIPDMEALDLYTVEQLVDYVRSHPPNYGH